MSNRTKVLLSISQILNRIAKNFGLAVIVTNHLMVKYNSYSTVARLSADDDDYSELIPALGPGWGMSMPNRFILYFEDEKR